MDKLSIKKFAIWARNELLKRVGTRAQWFGITEKGIEELGNKNALGKLLTERELTQKNALVNKIRRDGYAQAMEEAAYIWFNRFCALRFMEVNGYLPSRVFSDEQGNFNPQILVDAIHLGDKIKGLDVNLVFEMKESNRRDELYKYLLITQCEALKETLPGMFDKLDDYSELLFPDFLLREESVIEQMVLMIPEDDWKDQVQIIGWLYQYYNSEPKDEVFANLKKNIKINKDNIPAATQLFTPDWIVRYMVENALGRLWQEGHPDETLKKEWKYYLNEAEQEPAVEAQLAEIRKQFANMKPEDIKCIDPCMGSGHILVYMFDVLVQIYESYGYNVREAAAMILQHNLYGLDIDDRAAQLAYFAVMMKARQYDRRILSRHIAPHIYAIADSSPIEKFEVDYFCDGDESLEKAVRAILVELNDAKEYGSILSVSPQDWDVLYARYDALDDKAKVAHMMQLIRVAEVLATKYDVVVTNPPYMGSSGMNPKLAEYVKKNYPDSKSDLFAVFIERCGEYAKPNGYFAMITQHAWMFLSSFEELRKKIQLKTIINMAHLGIGTFEDLNSKVVQSVAYICLNNQLMGYIGRYDRLFEKHGLSENNEDKIKWLITGKHSYYTTQSNFSKIPGSPVAYWVGEAFIKHFDGDNLKKYSEIRSGMSTTDNDRFLRFWYEVDSAKINRTCSSLINAKESGLKWYPYNKGGEFRRWYGNHIYILNWLNDGEEVKYWVTHNPKDPKTKSWGRRIFATDRFFLKGITWSDVTSGKFSARLNPTGYIFDSTGLMCFPNNENDIMFILGVLNTIVVEEFLKFLAPTIHFNPGAVEKTPIAYVNESKVSNIVTENISLSRADWDAFETSWDFVKHPLL